MSDKKDEEPVKEFTVEIAGYKPKPMTPEDLRQKALSEERKLKPVTVGTLYAHVSNSGASFEILDKGHGPVLQITSMTFGNLIHTSEFKLDKATLVQFRDLLSRACDFNFTKDYSFAASAKAPVIREESGIAQELEKMVNPPEGFGVCVKGKLIGACSPLTPLGGHRFETKILILDDVFEVPPEGLSSQDRLHQVENMMGELTLLYPDTKVTAGLYMVQSFGACVSANGSVLVDRVTLVKKPLPNS